MKLSVYLVCIGVSIAGLIACGSSTKDSKVSSGTGAAPGSTASSGGTATTRPTGNGGASTLLVTESGGASSGGASSGSTGPLQCAGGICTCAADNTTTLEGFVYDPAGKNPLYNVSVYIPDPGSPLPNLDTVPLACGCSQLYPTQVLATGNPTDATGHFVIPCAPSGTVSLVVQTGKWRRQFDGITVTPNQANMAPKLQLPKNSMEGSLPNIAISTGGSDSLECLPLRIGVDASEYVLGSATGGHIHIYTGHNGATMAQGSVQSFETLWDQQSHLNEHDVVLLSCEGQETTGGTPGMPMTAAYQTFLMNYANTGGRVFASHYHYAWFNTGPFGTAPNQLATWVTGQQSVDDSVSSPADIDTTLAGGAAFPEGSALQQWLGLVGALTNNQLPIWFARNNVMALAQPPSTEWIHLDPSVMKAPSATQYFSADTPLGGAGGAVCGRVVYSDLHVSGGPGKNAPGVPPDYTNGAGGAGGTGGTGGAGGMGGRMGRMNMGGGMQSGTVPGGCAAHALTPQEEALEFMLFDLSSCLVPIGQSPPQEVVPK